MFDFLWVCEVTGQVLILLFKITFRLALLLPKDVYFVAIDFPGHGKSSHRWPGMPYIHFEYIADVKKVVSQLGWKTFSFIGHSMGANIASLYAGTFSGEVENLVLFDFGGPPTRPLNQTAPVLARYATRMSDVKKPSRVYPSLESAAKRRQVPFLGTTLCKEDAVLLSQRGTRITRNGVMFTHDPDVRALNVPFFIPQHSLLSVLSNIQCPVLALEGTDTVRLGPEEKLNLERLHVIYNSASFKLCRKIKGGHYFHLEKPELVAHEIRQFLALSCTSQGSSGKSKL